MHLTREMLSQRAGINPRTIARAESSDRISEDSLRRLAQALGASMQELARFPVQELQERLRQLGLLAPGPPEPWVDRPVEARRAIEHITGSPPGSPPHPCCIAGPSGIGKTALARFVVHQASSSFPRGVVWVAASRARRPVEAIDIQLRIADAFDLRHGLPPREHVSNEVFAEAFAAAFWVHGRLLVLDDVVDADLIDCLVPRGKACAVLVTTHLLHVAERFGDHVIALDGLPVEATRHILVHHLGESRIRADEEGLVRLHETLAGIPRSIHIAGKLLSRERLVALGEYASRVHDDPTAGQYPTAIVSPETSLALSFAQIQDHVSPGAWLLLGALSLFDEVSFSLPWAAAAAGTSVDAVRSYLSELLDVYLVMEETAGSAPPGAAPRFRLHSHVPLFARAILADHRKDALERLARHAASVARDTWERNAWDELRAEQVLWDQLLDVLLEAVVDRGELADWSGVPPFPGTVQMGDAAAYLVDIASVLAPYLERERVHGGGTLLLGAAACATALGWHADAARCLLALGRWWLRSRVDLHSPIRWFDAATALFLQAGMPAQAAAAASESGRALFGSQRPMEGLERFERAVTHARSAFDTGAELACRLNSAAVSFTRKPGLDGWHRAITMLVQAVEACAGSDFDSRLMKVVCTCNLASVGFVLDRVDGRPPRQHRHDLLDQALADWRALGIRAPIFEAQLLSLQSVIAAGQDPDRAAHLCARAATLWQDRLQERIDDDFLWQLGESAFYLRLYLAFLADPDQGPSPVIAQGFALSDLSRSIRFESDGMTPVGFLFPVAPLADVFDAEYVTEVIQIVEDFYGPSNRIMEELRAVEAASAQGLTGRALLPW